MDRWTPRGIWPSKDSLDQCTNASLPRFQLTIWIGTDTSLQGLGIVPSQKEDNGSIHVTMHTSRSMQPSEQSLWNYNSTKLDLLALKWVVMEKLKDYLIGSKFIIYTDNNLLAYVKESKLVVAQIWWLSKLALFDFDIKYSSGKCNQAADTLSQCPKTNNENFSNSKSDTYETIS